jgi:hypothetical protein
MDPVQIFEKPDTARTMHLWQMEDNMRLLSIGEPDESGCDCSVIKVIESAGYELSFGLKTRILVQRIVITQTILVQKEIDLPATLTTKGFFRYGDGAITLLSAMIAGVCNCLNGARLHRPLN